MLTQNSYRCVGQVLESIDTATEVLSLHALEARE
jgi:hypothetical protein